MILASIVVFPLPFALTGLFLLLLFNEAYYECIQPAVTEREDNSTATCQANGQWTRVAMTCLPVPCGHAPAVNNTDVTYNSFDRGIFLAQYTCQPGYIFATGRLKKRNYSMSNKKCSSTTQEIILFRMIRILLKKKKIAKFKLELYP